MKLEEAKQQFIQAWGTLGSKWGINRTMAQIHALLLVTPEAISADEIMEALNISRGNANMNLRDLMDWGLVEKIHKPGERKEFFLAEKDMWKVSTQVAKERKKRELEPVIKLLDQLAEVQGDAKDENYITFKNSINGIRKITHNLDNAMEIMVKADENKFFSMIMKLIR